MILAIIVLFISVLDFRRVVLHMTEREDLVELKAGLRMESRRIEALVNILAREGVISRDDFDREFDSLCSGQEGDG